MDQHDHPVLSQYIYPVYPVIISCKENAQKKALRLSFLTELMFYLYKTKRDPKLESLSVATHAAMSLL